MLESNLEILLYRNPYWLIGVTTVSGTRRTVALKTNQAQQYR